MFTRSPFVPAQRAFTLVELLAVICIIGILAGLLFPILGSVRRRTDRTATLASLHALGRAIQLYAGEHGGKLPGPLWSGNWSYYTSGDNRTFGYHLWSYLDAAPPKTARQTAAALTNPANTRYRQSEDSPVYFLNDTVQFGSDILRDPWANPSASKTNSPARMSALAPFPTAKIWAAKDIDQKMLGASVSYYAQLPPEPPLGDVRMTLFFDWHVEPVPVQ